MKPATQPLVQITKADYAGDLRLRVSFDDGVERTVDFGPFLSSSSHPEIRKYLDKRRFRTFAVDRGHLHWNDFDLVFPISDLYAGIIS